MAVKSLKGMGSKNSSVTDRLGIECRNTIDRIGWRNHHGKHIDCFKRIGGHWWSKHCGRHNGYKRIVVCSRRIGCTDIISIWLDRCCCSIKICRRNRLWCPCKRRFFGGRLCSKSKWLDICLSSIRHSRNMAASWRFHLCWATCSWNWKNTVHTSCSRYSRTIKSLATHYWKSSFRIVNYIRSGHEQ